MTVKITLDRRVFEDVVYQADITIDSIRIDYSGRNMYGAECLAITVENDSQMADFWINVGRAVECYWREDDDDKAIELEALSSAVRSDNLGHDRVYYFPGYTLSDAS